VLALLIRMPLLGVSASRILNSARADLSIDLDGTHVHYSYRQPCLLTLTVDGPNGQRNGSTPSDAQEWHLPTFDPRNETKYMYKLQSVDIYFWTQEDALKFVGGVRRVLPPQQITLVDEPAGPPSHADVMSPVVQKLENVAITDSSYQQGHTRDSRNASISSSLHGPQPSRESHSSQSSFQNTTLPGPPQPQPSQEPSGFAPLAYNPAAPAAPEAIKHREKTPPPEDGAANPLVAAANSDHGQAYGIPHQFQSAAFSGPPPQQSYFTGPPGQTPASPPPQQSYFTGPPGQTPSSPPPQQSYFTGPPGQTPASPTPKPQSVQSPYAHHFQNTFAPPPTTATNPPPGPPAYQPAQPPSYPGPPGMRSPGFAAPGGFSPYNYNPGYNPAQPAATDYSIHQQLYRPTEHEAATRYKPAKPPAGKLEARAGALEKGVNGLFKKLEKKIG
jgi:hypothetical protein